MQLWEERIMERAEGRNTFSSCSRNFNYSRRIPKKNVPPRDVLLIHSHKRYTSSTTATTSLVL